ncbi:uncharacterized protein DC041_0007517 [Schistosoma bovis]|uniref:Protein FAM184A/B N-terminal domain-containing protein n=1 Tax=Schistosoma bovis TaxID=6184 RepID=A0A430QCX4_SCHBO|nr:uncharacterized protein DC041_0007517 [Schistosoma bovis]
MPAYSFDYKSYMTNNLLGHDQDIHYKMSKKIAQLTKVVCMLNSRGEDSVDLLKETSKQHENEIIKLKSSYELKLRDLELRLEEEKGFGNTIAFLEKSISEKELEIINMESKCSQLINEHHLKEDMLRVKHSEEIIKLQQTIAEHKEKYEKELNTIQCLAEQWKSHQCPNIEPILNEKLQLECEFQRLQEKYSSLETEVEAAIKEDKFTSTHRNEVNSYECKIQELIKNIKDEENRKENELLEINKKLLQDLKNQQYIYDQSIIRNNQEKNELSNFIKHNTEIHLNNIWQGRLNQEREEFQIELSKLHKLNEEIKCNSSYSLNTEYINYQKETKLEYEKFHRKIIDLQLIEDNLKNELIIKNDEQMNLEKERNMKYLQLKKEYDECLEKIKITEAQLESKNENQLDKQNLILNSKYEDVQLKLKESRKLIKVLENKSQLLRKQLSSEKSNLIHLKENFTVKLRNLKGVFESSLLNIEQMKMNLSHVTMLLKQEIKIKYENLLNQKMIDLRKTLYNEIEQKINKIIKIKSNLEQVINKLTKELEECQLTNKQIELKLMNECKMKENLEKQLVKLSNEMERMRTDYENLSKQAKESFFFNSKKELNLWICDQIKLDDHLEKSSRFTDLVAELDRKWSETVGRECARVRSETIQQFESQYKAKLEEITNNYEKTIITMNKQWEMKIEVNKIDQSRNNNDQVTEQITKEKSSLINQLIDEKTKYEQEIKRKQIELEKAQINYDKLLEEFIQSQTDFQQIHVKLKSQLKDEQLANEEKLRWVSIHIKFYKYSVKILNVLFISKEYNEFILAQNILKSKIHELHQRLLGCSCKSSTILKQVKNNRLSANSQLLPEITMSNKQNFIFDTSSSSSLSSLPVTGTLSEQKIVYNHDYNLLSDQLSSQINENHHLVNVNKEKFHLPTLTT